MKTIRTIALYGNSLIVSSIGASLENKPGWRVVRMRDVLPDDSRQLDALAPDVLIFDLTTTSPDFAVALLQKRPALLLLGVDLLSGRMLVFSSQQSSALATDDLINVIENHNAFQNRAQSQSTGT